MDWVERGAAVVVLAVLVVLLVPVYRVALSTPFRLIDDVLDWRAAAATGWLDHLKGLFVGSEGARYRPLHDLGTELSWAVFGARAAWHHAARLALRVATFSVGWLTIRRLASDLGGGAAAPGRWASFTYAAALFLFFPNNPEARLAPQELLAGLAFVCFVAALAVAGTGSRSGFVLALVSFAAFCLAKEPDVVVAVALLPWVACELRRDGSLRPGLRFAPFAAVAAFALLNVAVVAAAGGYGTARPTPGLALVNLKYAVSYVLLPLDGLWLPVLVSAPVLYAAALVVRREARPEPVGRGTARARVAFLGLGMLGFAAVFLTSWTPALRYAYPLTVAVVLLNGLGVAAWLVQRGARGRGRVGRVAVPVVALCFVLATYHDFASQFVQQQVAGCSELALLDRIRALQQEGLVVGVRNDTEYEWSIRAWFNDLRAGGRGGRAGVAVVDSDDAGADLLVAAEPAGGRWRLSETVGPCPTPEIMGFAQRVTNWAPLRPRGIHAFADSGSAPLPYFPWFLYRRDDGLSP